MRMQSLGTAAAQLLELGFAADAVTLYSESLAVARDIPTGAPNYIGDPEGMAKQYRDGLTKAIEQLKPEDLAATLARTIRDEDTPPEKAKGEREETRRWPRAAAKKRDQFIDLMVMVHPRELDKATVRSLLADAIAPTIGSSPGETKGREQLAASMEDVRRKHPDDLSVAIAEALLAFGSGEDRADRGGTRSAGPAGGEDAPGPTPRRGAGQRASACRGRAPGPALAGRPRLLEAERRRQAGRNRRPARRPGPGGGPPPGREPDPAGDAPRAGRDPARTGRSQGSRGRLAHDARDRRRDRPAEGQAREAETARGRPAPGGDIARRARPAMSSTARPGDRPPGFVPAACPISSRRPPPGPGRSARTAPPQTQGRRAGRRPGKPPRRHDRACRS